MARKKGGRNGGKARKNGAFEGSVTGRPGKADILDDGSSLRVGYTDYEVPMFDGADYEVKYTLGASDRKKLQKALQADGYAGSLEEMILRHFGECLDEDSFAEYCKDRGIRYELFTWIG